MKILVADDTERLRQSLSVGLRAHGMVVETVADGASTLARMAEAHFDVVVLDLTESRIDGLQVLHATRDWHRKPRVLVLSARVEVADRIEALDLGADDYLAKPFAFEEVRARVQALARRSATDASPVLEVPGLRIDTALQIASVNGCALHLTPKEYALLELLVRRRGHVLSRTAIFEHLHRGDSQASDRVVESLLSTLRAKLEDARLPHLIQTRRGFGYLVP